MENDTSEYNDHTRDQYARWLPLALERPAAGSASEILKPGPEASTIVPTISSSAASDDRLSNDDDDVSSSTSAAAGHHTTLFYRLLTPEAAAEELRLRWAELVEPKNEEVSMSQAVSEEKTFNPQKAGDVGDSGKCVTGSVSSADSANSSDKSFVSVGDGKGGDRVWRWIGRNMASRAERGSTGEGGVTTSASEQGTAADSNTDAFVAAEGSASADVNDAGAGVGGTTASGRFGRDVGTTSDASDPDDVDATPDVDVDDGYDGGGLL